MEKAVDKKEVGLDTEKKVLCRQLLNGFFFVQAYTLGRKEGEKKRKWVLQMF